MVQKNIGNPSKRQRIEDVHVHGSASSHKKRLGSLNTLGNHRFSTFDSLALWDSVMGISPMFNPLEQRVLQFIAMHCFTKEPLSNLKDFPLQGFNYNSIFRVWDVCISAI